MSSRCVTHAALALVAVMSGCSDVRNPAFDEPDVRVTPGRDATMDATRDTSAADASAADAGGGDDLGPSLDASPLDARPTDTGLADAMSDAGLDAAADAGPPDLGPPDLGPPDLGPPDLGPPDLGPPDAGPPSCTALYGSLDGFILCAERPTECELYTQHVSGGTCDGACESRGGSCLRRWRDEDGAGNECVHMDSTSRSCDTTGNDSDICVCSR